MKNEQPDRKGVYTLESCGISASQLADIRKFRKHNDHYYISAILRQDEEKYKCFAYPAIINYCLRQDCWEKEKLEADHLICLLLDNSRDSYTENETHLVGAITFLYRDKNDSDETDFRIKGQECARLLLLLKNEIDEYVDHILSEKLFDMWIDKTMSDIKFESLYNNSNHAFQANTIKNDVDFDLLAKEELVKVNKSYFLHTNNIIIRMYSDIIDRKDKTFSLDLRPTKDMEIKSIFDEKFLALLNSYVRANENGQPWRGHLKIEIEDGASKTTFPKQILRAFVVQCLDNAMRRYLVSDRKIVRLSVNRYEVKIVSDAGRFNDKGNEEYLIGQKNDFEQIKKIYIDKMMPYDDFSLMTLTVLKAFGKTYNFPCYYGFDDNYCFTTRISLIPKMEN